MKFYNNFSKITGFFNQNNEAEGIAVYKCTKNNEYSGIFLLKKGEYKKNYLSGFGFSKGHSECCYIGEWVASKQSGFGIEIWNSGSIYKGELKNGSKEGIGTFIWSNGNYYLGEWEGNKMSGRVFFLF